MTRLSNGTRYIRTGTGFIPARLTPEVTVGSNNTSVGERVKNEAASLSSLIGADFHTSQNDLIIFAHELLYRSRASELPAQEIIDHLAVSDEMCTRIKGIVTQVQQEDEKASAVE